MKRNIKKIIASMLTSAMALGGANIAFAVNLPAPDVAEGYTRYEAEDAERRKCRQFQVGKSSGAVKRHKYRGECCRRL